MSDVALDPSSSEPESSELPDLPPPAPAAADVSPERRSAITKVVLLISVIGSMIHQIGPVFRWVGTSLQEVKLQLWPWYIEDAAISFAFARNWAAGDGLVAFPGHERVEGFTNASWTGLMALFYLVGVDGWWSSKLMALGFGGATVVLAWLIARELIPDPKSWAPLFAPVLLACFPNFAFWNASGLENSLFNFFLAGGLWRTMVELRRGGTPWASLWYLGLATTRPDGLLYAALAGFVHFVGAVRAGRGIGSSVAWVAMFFVPFAAFEAATYWYFAWQYPNTYYAKMLNDKIVFLTFTSPGIKYVRNWAWETNVGWFLPVVMAGLVGLRGGRRWAVLVGTLLAALGLLYPSAPVTELWPWWPAELPVPESWNEIRTGLIYAVALLIPLLAPFGRGGGGRALLWYSGAITLFFCIYSSGDWMKGFRWMSFLSVPLAVLLTVGIEEIASLVQRVFGKERESTWTTPGWLVATALVGGLLPGYFIHSDWFFGKRETGPISVKKRVDFTNWVLDRVYAHDRQIRNLDVDMGAHLYWSPTQMVDMAGLVDVSVAHHGFKQRAFTQEYIFTEKKPEIAHVHGGWASKSRIPTFAEWKRDYIELPGFPVSEKTNHMGHHIRRELLLTADWAGSTGRTVPFERGISLEGFDLPSPEVSEGKSFYLEVGVRYRRLEERELFRVVGFLSNEAGALFTFDLPPAYDWLPTTEWRVGEVFTGRFSFALPKELGPGSYDLGFVVLDAEGNVIPVLSTEAPPAQGRGNPIRVRAPLPEGVVVGGEGEVTPRFAIGEVRFPGVLTIGEAGTGERAAESAFQEALAMASGGSCEEAEARWRKAWLHLPKAAEWRTEKRALVAGPIAACWVGLARAATEPMEAVAPLEKARYWDRHVAGTWEVAGEVGGKLYARGLAAREAKDWEAAYAAFDGAVRADTRLSWARRYAEETRDERLGLVAVAPPPAPAQAPEEPEAIGGEGE